ncbi:chitin deacetylase 1-like isoform X2 [Amblyomma americanum]
MRRAACCLLVVLYGHCVFDVVRSAECHPSTCRLEDNCLCVDNRPPGNLRAADTPQFVMITFDDAVNEQNMDFYRELLAPGRLRNRANGCNVAATFFVSAGYTDYSFVHELHSAGNEIALHSITHRNNLTYWRTMDVAGWEAEFLGVRRLLRDYALIPERDMVGARAPFLEIGHGNAYNMMRKHGFLYDSSIVAKLDYLPLYPYTLDFGLQDICENIICPSGAYKGLWMVPLNMFVRETPSGDDSGGESSCVMPDTCSPKPSTASDMFDFLRSNFERYYKTNRAPFPVFIHQNWLWDPERKRGFLSFIDWLLTKKDVFLVTVEEVVQFMKDPKPLGKYSQKKCSRATRFQKCPKIYSCQFPESPIEETKELVGCKPCPKKYPWIEDFTN